MYTNIINLNQSRTPKLIEAINKELRFHSLSVNSGSVCNGNQANFFLEKGCGQNCNYQAVATIIHNCLGRNFKVQGSLDTEWDGRMLISEIVLDGRSFDF